MDHAEEHQPRRGSREGWALLRSTLARQRRGLALGIAAGVVWTLARVAVPFLVRLAIDRGIEAGSPDALLRWSLAILAVAVVSAAFSGARRYLAFREARWCEASLRDRLFAHVQRLHFAFHDETQTGQLMSRGNTDLQQVQQFVVMIPVTVANVVTVVAVTAILLSYDLVLAVLALAGLPLVNLFGRRYSQRLYPEVMGIQRESAELASVVEETVSGIRVVKGFGAEPVQRGRLAQEADDVYDRSTGAARVRATYLPALELVPNIGLIAVLAYGGHQVLAGELSIGTLVTFNLYVTMLIWPLRSIGMVVSSAQRASSAGHRVHEVLSTDPDIADAAHARPLPPAAEMVRRQGAAGEVRFEDVVFRYGDEESAPVLDHLDLTVPAGQSVALVGATGSGKSTVARLIPRFYDVESGRVTIDGHDVRDVRLRELRAAVGIVFEDTFLFTATIAENIAFADSDAGMDRIERAARLAGAHDFITRLPAGYETEIGERGFSLSGGQRQRIAIARAILADPRVLILDDATSSVDPSKEHEIRDALGEVMAGRTTIVIAHRPATVALADRVVLLDGGRAVAEGTHDHLLATQERYREVLAAAEADAGSASGGAEEAVAR